MDVTDCQQLTKLRKKTLSKSGNYDGHDIGGIVGNASYSSIIDCQNYGNVDGCYWVGGIVGGTSGNTIVSGCQNHGRVNYNGGYLSEFIGGIVGKAVSSSISQCKNTGRVDGYYTGGGIVGDASWCTVSHCLNLGDVCTWHERVGGIVGRAQASSVSNCLHLGGRYIYGTNNKGGIVGKNEGAENTYTNNYHRSNSGGIGGADVEGQAMYGYKIEPQGALGIHLEGGIGLAYEGVVYAGANQEVPMSFEIS